MRATQTDAPIWILKTGQTFAEISSQHGDFEDWITAVLCRNQPKNLLHRNVCVLEIQDDTSLASLPSPEACFGVVITGSHAMVTDAQPWMQIASQWLLELAYAQVPIFGICFGHQLLAHTLGGQVGSNPKGLEIGAVPIESNNSKHHDPIWCAMPDSFMANTVHYQSVLKLPEQATVLASNAHDSHHAFRWRDHVWGVQFHPEFTEQTMSAYLSQVQHQGHAVCEATPESANLLSRFGEWVIDVNSNAKPTQPA